MSADAYELHQFVINVSADVAQILNATGPDSIITGVSVRSGQGRASTLVDETVDPAELRSWAKDDIVPRDVAELLISAAAELGQASPQVRAAQKALTRAEQDLADTITARPGLRPWTPNRRTSTTGKTIAVKRCCNGCGIQLGDLVEHDFIGDSTQLTDVRLECPVCLPAIIAKISAEVNRWAGFDLARNINKILDTSHGEHAQSTP